MTIRQQGGIFGRHPSFESIELNGQDLQTELNAKADLTGDTFTGQVNINTPTTGGLTVTAAGNGEIIAARTAGASVRMQAQSAAGTLGTTSSHRFDLLSNGSARLRIETNADVNVLSGNLVIGTSGKGIDFSATAGTGTSELFSDYEEGVWTPTLTYATPGTFSASYTAQLGNYVKVGSLLTASFKLQLSAFSKGTATGRWFIDGFPFLSFNQPDVLSHGTVVYYDAPCSTSNQSLGMTPLATRATVYIPVDNGFFATQPDLDANSQVFGTLTYRTA